MRASWIQTDTDMMMRPTLLAVLFTALVPAALAETPKPAAEAPKIAYGLLLKQGEKLIFAPCRDRSYALIEDVSGDQSVLKALDSVGLSQGKKLYVELKGVVEGGVLKASSVNMARTEGRCQMPGTNEEVWRASGNEPGWVLAAGGEHVSLKRLGKPEISVPYTPFRREGKLALFEGNSSAGRLSVRLENVPCQDTMAEAVFNWSASVTLEGQTFKGCAWER